MRIPRDDVGDDLDVVSGSTSVISRHVGPHPSVAGAVWSDGVGAVVVPRVPGSDVPIIVAVHTSTHPPGVIRNPCVIAGGTRK